MNDLSVPDIIGGGEVVCYAVVNYSITTGNTFHIAEGNLLPSPDGFAIIKLELPDQGYLLLSCDYNWKDFADTWHESVEDAQYQAEFEYAGNNWIYK